MNAIAKYVCAGIVVAVAAVSAAYVNAATPTPPKQNPNAVVEMIKPYVGDLDGARKRGYVRMLVTMNRTNYFIDKSEQRGATYEAGKGLQDYLNAHRPKDSRPIYVAYVPVPREKLFDALLKGEGDIAAASLTVTPERLERVNFAYPVMRGVKEVLVTLSSAPDVSSPEALSGSSIYVRPSSSYFQSLTELNERLAAAGKPPVKIVSADERLEDEDILELVSAGVVPATVVDDYLANFWTDVLPNIRVQPNAVVRTNGEIAWAVRKTNPQLLAAVSEFTKANGQGTLLGNIILKRYFETNKWVKNPGADEDVERLRAVATMFRKYSDKYTLPWLLVAAQAYQESQIDQGKKNPTGAVGIMQIKPDTAAGDPILITGVDTSADRNIEAGVKYLRFIIDRYYKDEPMEQLDKGLFAIASYNAGPARVARLRKKAAQEGLDPNIWFGNVEVVAARDIGRETVDYVRNIYKYYVAYQLITESRIDRNEAKANVTQ